MRTYSHRLPSLLLSLGLLGCADAEPPTEPTACVLSSECAEGRVCHPTLRECVHPSLLDADAAASNCRLANAQCAPGFTCTSTTEDQWRCVPGVADAGLDAAVPEPDAAAREPDAAAREPDAAVHDPDAAVRDPDAAVRDPDAAVRDPDAAAPEPDAAQLDAAQLDAAQLDAAQPDAAQPDAAQLDAAQPDAAQDPDAAQPDAARVSLCDAEEHVLDGACVACPPGTRNAAGDDSSAGDTICDPVLCGRAERVIDSVCRPCAPGFDNAPGDAASGENTECDAVLCALDQRVEDQRCVPCAPGTTNAAGDNAAGPDTQCSVAPCGADCPGIVWIDIEGGTFSMGAADLWDSRLVHQVDVPSFQIAKTEVTVDQYAACVTAGVCAVPAEGPRMNWGVPGRGQHPVNGISWQDTIDFSTWVGARLPTEAEWEFAARGRQSGQPYPWGAAAPTCELAIHDDGLGCGSTNTEPVCSAEAGNTAQGLCDVVGNLWEWTADQYGNYDDTPRDGSAYDPGGGPGRVMRGGAWFNRPGEIRTARRWYQHELRRHDSVGFRPARSLP